MSALKLNLEKLGKFLDDNKNTFQFGFLTLLAAGGEQLFQSVTFNCPCDTKRARDYALTFLIAPLLLLFLLGIVLNKETWYYFHGCWKKGKAGYALFGQLFVICFKALIVPVVWIFVALLDGRYYACLYASQPCNTTIPEYENLKSDSVIRGWIVMASFMAFALTVVSINRCCYSSRSFIEKQYSDILKNAEELKMQEVFQKHAKEIGQANAEWFLANDGPDVEREGLFLTTHCVPEPEKLGVVTVTSTPQN